MSITWEKEVKATAWKHGLPNSKSTHLLQIDQICGKRKENRIRKAFKEWITHGEGYNPKSKESTLIFKKSFNSEAEWKKWARNVQFDLIEIGTRSGKPKKYKLGLAYLKTQQKKKEI